MEISNQVIKIIEECEGFKSEAYLDEGGLPTIGFGTTRVNGQPVHMGMTCTREEAEEWIMEHLNGELSSLQKLITVDLNQNQLDAIADFAYNEGIGAFGGSTLLRRINSGDFDAAADQFSKWITCKGKILQGLVKRRNLERTLFTTPV